MVVRLIDRNGAAAGHTAPDEALLGMIGTARRWWRVLREGEINIKALATREGVTSSWMTRVLRLAFLAPSVVEAVLDSKINPKASGRTITQIGAIPACWREQDARYLLEGSAS